MISIIYHSLYKNKSIKYTLERNLLIRKSNSRYQINKINMEVMK